MKITCIVPVYNEEPRVGYVLTQLSKVKNIDEIICVDDGSTDGSINVISSFDRVTLIRTPKNQGKTGAIREGVKHASGDYILLYDADLTNISEKELNNNLKLLRKSDTDMLILRRINFPEWMSPLRPDMLITGERAIKKKHLEQILSKDISGFEIEIASNHYMIENNLNVKWLPNSAMNTRKPSKHGRLMGMITDIKMHLDIFIFNKGFIKYRYIDQLTKFYPKKLK